MFVVAAAHRFASRALHCGRRTAHPGATWHWISNGGDDDVVSVFSFPGAELPPTERRDGAR